MPQQYTVAFANSEEVSNLPLEEGPNDFVNNVWGWEMYYELEGG